MHAAQLAQGPFFIGIALDILLYGMMITQAYSYFFTYKDDRLWIKIFVAFLFSANTVSSTLSVMHTYRSFVNPFGFLSWLVQENWVSTTGPSVTSIIGGSVQLFFTWRVYVLSRNVFSASAIVFCSSAGMLVALGTTIAVAITPDFFGSPGFRGCCYCTAGECCLRRPYHRYGSHVAITVFRQWNRKNGFPVTSDVDRVIRMTIQTGFITTLFAVTDLVTFLTVDTGIYLIFDLPLAKLHTNSLLSNLNSRGGWKYDEASEESNCNQGNLQREIQSNVLPQVFVHVEQHKLVETNDTLHDIFGKPNPQSDVWSD
ncbi:hypothetical protein F5J12DRAFT_305769 [Pisolithus orientalis]|uniref:uncharacterized protein n=1 Tax=Pisolithus orientalis TaxID=936130 RepID=UPI0022245D31|nr:uncharacterized protein F5J12DRAFT_305769 [Pisolithus orientalis]KAI6030721.1 hypothetical protein F5J12DRAFT_305769 [Pisolithus orientalis]